MKAISSTFFICLFLASAFSWAANSVNSVNSGDEFVFSGEDETLLESEMRLAVDATAMTPAARRAHIRDSLRQERLKAREAPSPTPPVSNLNPGANAPTPQKVDSPAKINAGQNSDQRAAPEVEHAAVSPTTQVSEPIPVESENLELPVADSIRVKSLNVRDTEIRDVLQGLGIQYGINIVLASDVAGSISVNLNNIPLKEALKLITSENGYQLSVVHGAIKVEKKAAPKPLPPPPSRFEVIYEDGKLSVDLQKIPAQQAVRQLVEVTGKNIVMESGSDEALTAFFKEMELRKGLALVAESNGLALRERDGVYAFYREAWATQTGPAGSSQASNGPRMRVQVLKEHVTLEVTQAPLADVIAAISAQSGIGTVIYGDLKGTVTMRVQSVPLEQAFQILFRGTESTFWVTNGVYFIGPHSMQVLNNSKLIVLKHLKVDEVMEALPQNLTKEAQLKVVKSQNAIMAMGTYDVLDGISQYISQIDRPVPQILIEALVVDVDMDKIRNYGVDMFLGDYRNVASSEHIYPNVEQVLNRDRSQDVLSAIPGLRKIISLPKNFVAKVEALEQEKILKIRSRPQIATLNGSEATITVGQTQYFLLKTETDISQVSAVTARTTERFEKIEANVTLTVTPYVTGQGEITCDIVPDFSEPEGSFDSRIPPTLNRRVLKSKVRLRDGETIVLGGLVKESVNRTTRQVPFFGSIPILGWLFKNNSSVKTRSQLMIFVTPHVYYGNESHVDPKVYLKEQAELK
jgi:type II secretory pathway component GspD/PulD (secretin)